MTETPIGPVKVRQLAQWLEFLEMYYVKTYRTTEDIKSSVNEFIVWPDVTAYNRFYMCGFDQSTKKPISEVPYHIVFDPESADILVESSDDNWVKIDMKTLRSLLRSGKPFKNFQHGGRRRSRKVKKAHSPQ